MARIVQLTPRKTPRQGRSRASVEAILTAGAQILEAGGIGALTTNAVADRAGVSIGTLYQYFPNKQTILAELVRRQKMQFFEDMSGAVQHAKTMDLRCATSTVLHASILHHARAPVLSRELEKVEATIDCDEEDVCAAGGLVDRQLIELLESFGIAWPEVAARDLSALCRGMVHAALMHGECDLDAIEARLRPAVFGYLGIAEGGA
ncbi:TetR/AcrR family transcriptional regulator [Salipiger mangrovisoli]|uniref:TetR/AcrR family transcriptional regulator n=1 Tax=Salipiger mangrovisoli TaxID=2865933 RepID=A0ABR9WXQ0_9RHOB|nr:TetR/AcrR family transcriptional regulator [Salipiger mangrovisoli]MBE9636075.1 TetR/AcrR family transcriptional regulator [Salipiger mangrovisoli]